MTDYLPLCREIGPTGEAQADPEKYPESVTLAAEYPTRYPGRTCGEQAWSENSDRSWVCTRSRDHDGVHVAHWRFPGKPEYATHGCAIGWWVKGAPTYTFEEARQIARERKARLNG